MNVLITGIDGFVGSHLAEEVLTHPSVRLFGLVEKRGRTWNLATVADRIQFHECDITNAGAIREVIQSIKPDQIYHLAGQAFVPFSIKNPSETFRVNIEGGLNLLEAIRFHVPSCAVLIVSSGEVYGAVKAENLPITELCPFAPGNPYAASKACIDLIAQQYKRSYSVQVVVVRPFNHIGPRQSEQFVASAFAKQIAEIKLGRLEPRLHVGNLAPKRDFTDVKDIVRAYHTLLSKPVQDTVFNICSGNAVSVRDILDMLCDIAGVTVEIVPDPERMRNNEVPLVVGSAEQLHRVTGWEPKIPLRETLQSLMQFWIERIRTEEK
jgi:GDP-4-dehydro-6-deoxy-D-mannose reductase